MAIENLLAGKEVQTKRGTFYAVDYSFQSCGTDILSRYIEQNLPALTAQRIAEKYSGLKGAKRQNILFVDIETCGLTYKDTTWLITLANLPPETSNDAGEIVFTSQVARDYGEEGPLLENFLQKLHDAEGCVTLNGKRFDLPRTNRRAQSNGVFVNGFQQRNINQVLGKKNIDLRDDFHTSLQNIERLAGYSRKDDLPGRLIPQVYHDYVHRVGDQKKTEQLFVEAIRHNVIDTRSTLYAFMAHVLGNPRWTPAHYAKHGASASA